MLGTTASPSGSSTDRSVLVTSQTPSLQQQQQQQQDMTVLQVSQASPLLL
jgi:hypothetical protein